MLVRVVAGSATMCVAAAAVPVTIPMGNGRSAVGQGRIDICTQATFLTRDGPCSRSLPSQAGTTTVTARAIAAGRHAVQAFQDGKGNHEVDRILFGPPREGIGFSNDAALRMSPPKRDAAALAFDRRAETIALKLRYFL